MTEYKEKAKKTSEYEDLKESREKNLVNELDEYLKRIRMLAAVKFASRCEKLATRDGEVDEIDEKLCMRNNAKTFEHTLIKILPELTQHSMNYQQCLKQCEKNHIGYLIANQSCRSVYQKGFKRTTQSLTQRLRDNDSI